MLNGLTLCFEQTTYMVLWNTTLFCDAGWVSRIVGSLFCVVFELTETEPVIDLD